MSRKGFEVTPELKVRINKLATLVGCVLNWGRNPDDSFQYDKIDIACEGQDASNILHDIAHYVLASKEERAMEDFGLGDGPDSGESMKRKLSMRKCDKLEEQASVLGIFWEKSLNLNHDSTYVYHDWKDEDPKFHSRTNEIKSIIKKCESQF